MAEITRRLFIIGISLGIFVSLIHADDPDLGWVTPLRGTIAQGIKYAVNYTGDTTSDGTAMAADLDMPSLVSVYNYDRNDIMYRLDSHVETPVEIPYMLLHRHFIHLLNTARKNIYVSDFFEYNNICYYFVGRHVLLGNVLLLFSIDKDFLPAGTFAVFNKKGEKLISKGLSVNEVNSKKDLLINNIDNTEKLSLNQIYGFSIAGIVDKLYVFMK